MIGIHVQRTKAALQLLKSENNTFLDEYKLDRDNYFAELPEEKKNDKLIIAQKKSWEDQKTKMDAVKECMGFVCDTLPDLINSVQMAEAMPIGSKEENLVVMKLCKMVAGETMKVLRNSEFADSGFGGYKAKRSASQDISELEELLKHIKKIIED